MLFRSLKDMKNDVILKKDPFPKTVAEACHVLSKWRNNYSKYNNGKNESNEGIAFTTITDEKEANKSKKRKESPASGVRRKDTIQTNVLPKNCLRRQKRKVLTF